MSRQLHSARQPVGAGRSRSPRLSHLFIVDQPSKNTPCHPDLARILHLRFILSRIWRLCGGGKEGCFNTRLRMWLRCLQLIIHIAIDIVWNEPLELDT